MGEKRVLEETSFKKETQSIGPIEILKWFSHIVIS